MNTYEQQIMINLAHDRALRDMQTARLTVTHKRQLLNLAPVKPLSRAQAAIAKQFSGRESDNNLDRFTRKLDKPHRQGFARLIVSMPASGENLFKLQCRAIEYLSVGKYTDYTIK